MLDPSLLPSTLNSILLLLWPCWHYDSGPVLTCIYTAKPRLDERSGSIFRGSACCAAAGLKRSPRRDCSAGVRRARRQTRMKLPDPHDPFPAYQKSVKHSRARDAPTARPDRRQLLASLHANRDRCPSQRKWRGARALPPLRYGTQQYDFRYDCFGSRDRP